jgi:hypothetical protein
MQIPLKLFQEIEEEFCSKSSITLITKQDTGTTTKKNRRLHDIIFDEH